MAEQFDAVHVQIAGGDRHAADLLRDLQAGLLAVRRAQIAVQRVVERRITHRRSEPGGQEGDRRRWRGRPADNRLPKATRNPRLTGEEPRRVIQIAAAGILRRVEDLPDARSQAVVEDSEARGFGKAVWTLSASSFGPTL